MPVPARRFRPALECLEDRTLLSAGGLDPAFGSGGIVITPNLHGDLAIQGSDRILVADFSAGSVTRYDRDGTLDSTFGNGGTISTGFTGPVLAVAVQGDRKIVVADTATVGGQMGFAVARFNPDGSPDTTFGVGGRVTTPIGSKFTTTDVVVQADGRIVVTGLAPLGDLATYSMARYRSDGSLDPSFGSGGIAQGGGTDLALQSDGHILKTIIQFNRGTVSEEMFVSRSNADGTPDSTFHSIGFSRFPGSGGVELSSPPTDPLAVTGGDKFYVIAGVPRPGGASSRSAFFAARYNPDGTPDTSFGQNGSATTLVGDGDGLPEGLAVQANGKLVVAGSAQVGGRAVIALVRYNVDGSLDTSFGAGGVVTTAVGPAASAFHVALQRDGGIIVAGSTTDSANASQGVLARYQGDPVSVSAGGLFVTGADAGGGPNVVIFDANTHQQLDSFFAYESTFAGGVRVAMADVNGDGVPDVITAPGPGRAPEVKVFSGTDFGLLFSFMAYDPGFTGGVWVAAGDTNNDGFADVVCGADRGGGPNIAVYSGKALAAGQSAAGALLFSFFAYDPGFTGGVRIAAGDVDGDGFADIVCGAGPGGGPNVTVFSGKDAHRMLSFFAFDPGFTKGIYVAAADVTGTGKASIVVGAGAGGGPNVTVFDDQGRMLLTFFPYDAAFTGGVRVAGVTRNGQPLILSVAGPGGGPDVRIFTATGTTVDAFFAYDPGFTGGIYVAGNAS